MTPLGEHGAVWFPANLVPSITCGLEPPPPPGSLDTGETRSFMDEVPPPPPSTPNTGGITRRRQQETVFLHDTLDHPMHPGTVVMANYAEARTPNAPGHEMDPAPDDLSSSSSESSFPNTKEHTQRRHRKTRRRMAEKKGCVPRTASAYQPYPPPTSFRPEPGPLIMAAFEKLSDSRRTACVAFRYHHTMPFVPVPRSSNQCRRRARAGLTLTSERPGEIRRVQWRENEAASWGPAHGTWQWNSESRSLSVWFSYKSTEASAYHHQFVLEGWRQRPNSVALRGVWNEFMIPTIASNQQLHYVALTEPVVMFE